MNQSKTMDDVFDVEKDFVQLARLAMDEKTADVAAFSKRVLRRVLKRRPDLAELAKPIFDATPAGVTRSLTSQPIPVDTDSRLELLRREVSPEIKTKPIWASVVANEIEPIFEERRRSSELLAKGLVPTRSMLFVGPPGVGKTLAAKWIALQLGRPLLTLDLSAVMSSYLGRTGSNIRVVLDYARRGPSVLLLDEFDAIAKRRDDSGEIGELKRLVTVLLQEIDDWPADGLLIAATNHPELLDSAVWRRFDRVVRFPLPTLEEVSELLAANLELSDATPEVRELLPVLASMLQGESFAEVIRRVNLARRTAVLADQSLLQTLQAMSQDTMSLVPKAKKLELARAFADQGFSQRAISAATGLARDTLRKRDIGAK
ncbi:ATP-binding protein [Tunturibacter psychrotolerans]|uniref:ATP-binding protein n=1 Tax=Tunturiibacter psychrotolerans TaxID=3069686 RepID=A0AAU7ZSJ2_9BACT